MTMAKLDLLKKAYENDISLYQEKTITGTFSPSDDFIQNMADENCSNFDQANLWENQDINDIQNITYTVNISNPDELDIGKYERALANVPTEDIVEDEDGTTVYNLVEQDMWQFLRTLLDK